jgi:large subunit ribosomal protein L20
MPRSQNKVASHRRRKRVMAQAKGYWGARSKVLTVAKHHIEKGLQHAYRGRKLKKRDFRQLWITRINAAARLHGTTYSRLIDALAKKKVEINRKVLAELAVSNPEAFAEVVKFAGPKAAPSAV